MSHSGIPFLAAPLLEPDPLLLATASEGLAAELIGPLRALHFSARWVRSLEQSVQSVHEMGRPSILLLDEMLLPSGQRDFPVHLFRPDSLQMLWAILMGRSDRAEAPVAGAEDFQDYLPAHPDAQALAARLQPAHHALRLMRQFAQQHHAARFHAEHDSLTGLWNRESLLRHLHAETDRAQRQNSPVALALLDLDHFSHVNLDYGYDVGDSILQEISSRFRRFLRSYDLVGRCGEDEFLFALPGSTSEDAAHLTARLRQMIFLKPFQVGREQLTLTASIGISHSVGRSPLIVLREAERALAAAKAEGRDRQRLYDDLLRENSLQPAHGPRLVSPWKGSNPRT